MVSQEWLKNHPRISGNFPLPVHQKFIEFQEKSYLPKSSALVYIVQFFLDITADLDFSETPLYPARHRFSLDAAAPVLRAVIKQLQEKTPQVEQTVEVTVALKLDESEDAVVTTISRSGDSRESCGILDDRIVTEAVEEEALLKGIEDDSISEDLKLSVTEELEGQEVELSKPSLKFSRELKSLKRPQERFELIGPPSSQLQLTVGEDEDHPQLQLMVGEDEDHPQLQLMVGEDEDHPQLQWVGLPPLPCSKTEVSMPKIEQPSDEEPMEDGKPGFGQQSSFTGRQLLRERNPLKELKQKLLPGKRNQSHK